ncbi:hypothetical protein [Clostridium omnivorum]|uniref:Spore coat protein n=1 Tax=Clostridium omnivorum TaxID=1604902 RepID=A0ABQ5N7N9_9CLOT|nr:hypothetical protein [Clostridium sp. E14]GLC31258.1 hypothetical protein bsdE14_26680 [Clostridium sp. E14]
MESKPKLSHHEAMELHELINDYMVGVKKLNEEMSKVQDEELKNFMEDSLNNKITKLQEIDDFFNNENQQQSEESSQEQYPSWNHNQEQAQGQGQSRGQGQSSQ